MEEKSIAEKIAALLDDDGRKWVTRAGVSLEELVAEEHPRTVREFTKVRWIFGDGSVITADGCAWDLGYPDCWCWQGVGHTCQESDDE